mmetsp:Transcript_8611/g.19197  ORF Transcript_8611/g.19197 Transcript_8611/m.19197 type:complete len:224 (+) Transcript_8611:171-842(+)
MQGPISLHPRWQVHLPSTPLQFSQSFLDILLVRVLVTHNIVFALVDIIVWCAVLDQVHEPLLSHVVKSIHHFVRQSQRSIPWGKGALLHASWRFHRGNSRCRVVCKLFVQLRAFVRLHDSFLSNGRSGQQHANQGPVGALRALQGALLRRRRYGQDVVLDDMIHDLLGVRRFAIPILRANFIVPWRLQYSHHLPDKFLYRIAVDFDNLQLPVEVAPSVLLGRR